MKTSEALYKAAREIEQRGWGQRTYWNRETGCVCAEGALFLATGSPLDEFGIDFGNALSLTRAFSNARTAMTAALGESIPGWNDHTARSADEVTAKLRQVAAQQEALGN